MSMTLQEMVVLAGETLTGDDNWAKPLARELGFYHPDGPRATIDPRSVSRWRTGEMEVLQWAADALPLVLKSKAICLEDEADRLTEAAARVKEVAGEIEDALWGPQPRRR